MKADGTAMVKSEDKLHWIALLLLMVTATVLRFYDLDRTGIWADEAYSWYQSNRSFMDMIIKTSHDNHLPLHNIVLNLTIHLFGDSEIMLRVPSALLGTLAVFLTYLVGSALWDRPTGLLACLLITISGFHIWYSQEIRMYSLLSCTAVYFVLTAIHVAREPSRKHLVINGFAGVLLLFSHFYGSFVFAGINLFILSALLQKRAWVKVSWTDWIVAQIITVVIFSPWARIMLARANSVREEGFWIPELSAGFLLESLAYVAGGELALLGFCTLGLIAVLSQKSLSFGRYIHNGNPGFPQQSLSVFAVDWRLGLVLAWLFSSLFFGLAVTAVFDQNIIQARYLSGSVPAFVLLGAVGIRQLQFSRPLQLLAFSAAIAVSLPAVHHSLSVRDRNDPRAVISSVREQFLAGDQILVYRPWLFHLFEYYVQGTEISSHITRGPGSLEQWTPDSDRFWIVTLFMGERETRKMFKHLAQTHKLAFSRLDHESQAYLFVQKVNEHQ